jgi:very-short-patch-repair endonuclease
MNKTLEEYKQNFLDKAKKAHGDKYDYSHVEYKNFDTRVEIVCKVHGNFWQTPGNHIRYGCGMCGKRVGGDKLCLKQEDVIKRAKEIHGDKYDYSQFIYVKMKIKSTIICPEHGAFEQCMGTHILNKCGCRKCAGVEKYTNEQVIEKFKQVHGDKYDYSLVKYNGVFEKVDVICPDHGAISIIAKAHWEGAECGKCWGRNLNNDEIIEKFKKVHGDTYDYNKVEYKKQKTFVIITCKKHGDFKQRPGDHLRGCGCQKCSESRGEKRIRIFLTNNNYNFKAQKFFKDCRNDITGKVFKFDFYLEDQNMCIEFDGIYHYEEVEFNGGNEVFIETKRRDEIKNNYCKDKGMKLIRIPYWEYKNIEEILKRELG